MEDSEIHDEILKEIQKEINVDQDKLITIHLLKNGSSTVEKVIEQLHLSSFSDGLYKKYAEIKNSALNVYENEKNENEWRNLNEDDNYEELLTNLSQSQFLSSDMLDELLKINFIDTRQIYWSDISNKLQACFSCLDHHLFMKSLEIHYKIIMSWNCCIDGYLSLLKAVNRIIKSHLIEKESLILNNRVLMSIKIILRSEVFMLNSIHSGSDRVMEDIIDNIFDLFSFQSNIRKERIAILDFVSFIDENANWFKYLCSSGFTKPIISRKIGKHPIILKLIFDKFLIPLNDNLYNFCDDLDKSLYKHSCYFLLYFLNIHRDIKGFEMTIHENIIYSFPQLVALIIYTINNHISSEIRETLKNFIVLLFQLNQSLINQEILEIMFKPFETVMKDNSMKVIDKNVYLFEMMKCMIQYNDKFLTEGYLYNRRKYKALFNFGQYGRNMLSTNENFVNLPQLIVDITIMMMRNYINTSEQKQSVDKNTLLLLECCDRIYNSHPVFLYNALTPKFIICLSSFYKALNNFKTTKMEIEKVLNIFSLFLKYHWNIFKLFKDEFLLSNILSNVISSKIEVSSHMVFTNLSEEILIENKLQHQLHLVAQSFLLSAWFQDNIEDNIETYLEEDRFIELLHFIYGISYSTKLIRLLVNGCPNSNIEIKGILPIPTLLKLSVKNFGNTLETFTGLLFIRILISNLDGSVILQRNYGMKVCIIISQN